jgi:Transmembrane protein 65
MQVCSGAAIEDTLGASLGLSTLAAAGLGNAASDGIGIGMYIYVVTYTLSFQLLSSKVMMIHILCYCDE